MKRIALFVLPVLVGIAIFVALVFSQRGPEQAAVEERVYPVRTISAPVVDMVPSIRAYGSVVPGRVWQASAEITGKVIHVHPRLEPGEFMPSGAVLLRIDPTDYRLAVSQIKADIEATRAQLVDNDVRGTNTRASLAIERESLDLSEKELQRRKRLSEQGAFAQSSVDEQERAVLAQRQSVVAQENALRLLPAERRILEAQLARYRSQLQVAERDLDRTTFTLPFEARIAAVNVEENESVRVGDVLVQADDIRVAQIQAEIPLQRMRNTLISSTLRIQDLDRFKIGELLAHVKTKVRLADFDLEWEARTVRLSPNLDPQTRTVGVVVEVQDHYQMAIPGVRPPLVKDMFVEVHFWGAPQPNQVVVPRTAVRENQLYLVGQDGRLELRPVTVGLVQPEFVSIAAGLEPGEFVVVSDLIPAIEGMLLESVPDQAVLDRLTETAQSRPE